MTLVVAAESRLAVAHWSEVARISPLPTTFQIQGLLGGSAMASCLQGRAWLPCASSLGLCLVFAEPTFPFAVARSAEGPLETSKRVRQRRLTSSAAPSWLLSSPAPQSTTHLLMEKCLDMIASVPRRLRSAGPISFFFSFRASEAF
jgi:hypothetical protein